MCVFLSTNFPRCATYSSSQSSSSVPPTIFPKPSTTATHVAGSKLWVIVAITPKSVISSLIIATGFSSMISANSATVTGPLKNCETLCNPSCFQKARSTYSGSATVLRSSAAAAFASFSTVRSRFLRLPRRLVSAAARPFLLAPSRSEVFR